MDFFPTLLKLAKAEIPQDRVLDGFDITPLLIQEEKSVREVTFYYRDDELYAVRKGPWKAHFKTVDRPYSGAIIEEHDPPLLFNLEVDPSEKYNVAEPHSDIIEAITQIVAEHNANLESKPSQLEKKLEQVIESASD